MTHAARAAKGCTSPFPPPRTLLQAAPTPQTHPRLLSAPCLLPGFVPAAPGLACASQPRWDHPKRLLVLSQTSGHAASACSYSPRSGFPKSQLGWPQRGARGSPSAIKMCKVNPNSNPISNPSPLPRACQAPGWEQRGGKAEQLPSLQPQVKLQPYRISDSRGTAGWGRASCAPLPTPSTHASRFGAFGSGMRLNGDCSSSGLGYPHPHWVHGAGRAAALKQGAVGPGSRAGRRRSWPGRRGRRPRRGWLGQAPGMSPSTSPKETRAQLFHTPGSISGVAAQGADGEPPPCPAAVGRGMPPAVGSPAPRGAAPGCG